jgi:hypothetical protein
LEERKNAFGADHLDTYTSQANMALLIALAKWADKMDGAEAMARAAQNGFAKHLGDAHPLTHFGSATLGVVLQAKGKHAEAQSFLQQAHDGIAGNDAGTWVVAFFQADFEALVAGQ